MDAFFDPADSTHPSSPAAHAPSPPASISLEDMPPHVAAYSSPGHYSHPDFDAKPFYSPSEAYHPTGAFTPPADYSFGPSSAPELSHVDLVHQEIVQQQQSDSKIVVGGAEPSAAAYWSPSPDVAAHTPTPASTSQANTSFLSELYASEPMAVTHSNGVSPDALTTSGPNSPTWSVGEGHQEQEQSRHLSSPGYASDGEHHLFRRASCPNWSTNSSSQHNTPTQQHPHPSRERDDVLPPVSTLLFDHHRTQQQSSQSVFDYHRGFEVHTPPEGVHSFELRPVIYGNDMSAEPSSFHHRHMDDVYMRPAHSHDFGQLDYEPKGQESPSLGGGQGLVHNVPIMYTDDAASKETQYLRRRCFNCRATEPPSWRRSTLNPGKIVCNKCGLYERTHLRPRPHRFDELRGGGAVTKRKTSKTLITGMPSSGKAMMLKADGHSLPRRTSMASMTSTTSSDANWDDYSVSSASSTPPFNSPTTMEFPHNVQSGVGGPITLPQPPLLPRPRPAVRKASTSSLRGPWSPPMSQFITPSNPSMGQASVPRRTLPAPHDYFSRRGSFDVATLAAQRRQQQIPVETGWQTIPLEDVRPRNPKAKATPIPIRTGA